MTEAVRDYYGSSNRRELDRLETPEGRLEFQLTTRLLHPHLPATGRDHLAPTGVHEIAEADARDLTRWPGATFAATLALGPFYHLPDPEDRSRALSEIIRVTAPGGLVAIALIPRFTLLRRTLTIPDERARLTDLAFVDALLTRGAYSNPHPGRFTSASSPARRQSPASSAPPGICSTSVAHPPDRLSLSGFAGGPRGR
ncbi:class I SAM-dependent methyltransferase [Winogradskya humida]|uniref:class I SAM-dependent methyltransferase n=1 Tax=Winogradskya humida TaxID=113566 RepID=UPI001EF3071F|nr:class I SAM-dependent methyltransferase [Actinoplanes humidus]